MTERETNRADLFDRWAASYDESVPGASFPLAGYDDVLDTIVSLSRVELDHRVLDVGIGTGNLAHRIATTGGTIWGIDFPREMIERARAKLPEARFVRADLRDGWANGLPDRVDRIVSAHVFHEFSDVTKLRLLGVLAAHLTSGGRIVIGDVAFPDEKSRDDCHRAWRAAWHKDEHHWTVDPIRIPLEDAGFAVAYERGSCCGDVLVLEPVG